MTIPASLRQSLCVGKPQVDAVAADPQKARQKSVDGLPGMAGASCEVWQVDQKAGENESHVLRRGSRRKFGFLEDVGGVVLSDATRKRNRDY
ncbi:hypothetical protein N7462_001397 [Penicillium macrosclerotiorum]|uniref:uncharacterized protein n=1 Tax=Penicillium macrosclerotiorum TaxID=303699 RepID=UPI002546E7C7|nr:uncharacterized protein N7462_001397 [Penicillium macrosclerotiorum]KAJ5691974.1 hypothetical protein N7462_001397 [Penicillium macrosclerotiorum]